MSAANADHKAVNAWAKRHAGRPPVLAILSNPPYARGGLDYDSKDSKHRYATLSWATDIYEPWTVGSGGGSAIRDLYIGFWAWAFNVCQQAHEAVDGGKTPYGVVSFITNRNWIEGRTAATMRKWVADRASRIDITDFGPGSLDGGAGSWSAQPFAIEAGTAIVTVTFEQKPESAPADITYRRATWTSQRIIKVEDASPVIPRVIVTLKAKGKKHVATLGHESWTATAAARSLTSDLTLLNGVQTAGDSDWLKDAANQTFSTRYAYKPFDNRWGPRKPPPKAKSKESMKAGVNRSGCAGELAT